MKSKKVGNGFSIENVALELAKYLNEHPASTEFLVGGYTNDEPFVYAVTMGCISRLNKNDNTEITYGANWKGRIDAAVKLLGAGSDATYAFHLMPLKDAVEFAEYIVELTIKYEKFTDILQTCGGSIDILVLTKDDAVFYQHKIYNPKRF